MSSDDDTPPEAQRTSATVHRSHPPRGPFGTARALLTRLGARFVERLAPSPPNPRHEPEPRRTVELPVQWFLPAESDEELALAGLRELEAQSAAALGEADLSVDEPEEMAGVTWWPTLRDKLTEQLTKTGAFTEPTLKAPSAPVRPTLLDGGLDGAVVPPERDDAQKPAPRAKKPPKADSVAAPSASPEERHKRAVLALVGAEPRGAAKKAPIDPIDAADPATCRAALRAVRDAVYGVSPDDLDDWAPGTNARTTVWLSGAPMVFDRTAEVHDALAEYGLDVHAENEALVAFAQASGILLVGLDDLDLPDDARGEE